MFRIFFRNLAIQKYLCDDLPKIRPFSTGAPTGDLDVRQEYNHVVLKGTMISSLRELENGAKSFILRTVNDRDIYMNHHINVMNGPPVMTNGQRFDVRGTLSSKPFATSNGSLQHNLIVKAGTIREYAGDKDMNNIKVLAKISSDMRHTDKFTTFILETNRVVKGSDGKDRINTYFYRVIIYDEAPRKDSHNINRFDRVLVEGEVAYKPYKNTFEKTQHGGFIKVKTIQQMDIF